MIVKLQYNEKIKKVKLEQPATHAALVQKIATVFNLPANAQISLYHGEQNRESINCNDDLVRAIRKTEPSHSQLKVRVILENEQQRDCMSEMSVIQSSALSGSQCHSASSREASVMSLSQSRVSNEDLLNMLKHEVQASGMIDRLAAQLSGTGRTLDDEFSQKLSQFIQSAVNNRLEGNCAAADTATQSIMLHSMAVDRAAVDKQQYSVIMGASEGLSYKGGRWQADDVQDENIRVRPELQKPYNISASENLTERNRRKSSTMIEELDELGKFINSYLDAKHTDMKQHLEESKIKLGRTGNEFEKKLLQANKHDLDDDLPAPYDKNAVANFEESRVVKQL